MVMPWAVAADQRPSWECLPAETSFMVRLPGIATFWKTIQERTKFGAIALSPQRLEGLWKSMATIKDDAGLGPLESFEEELAKYGLAPDDIAKVFDGECGAGIVSPDKDGKRKFVTVLGWIEPGEEVAGKLLAAVHQGLDEQADDDHGPRRFDLELAGHTVTAIVSPVREIDLDRLDFEGDIDEETVEARLEEIAKAEMKKVGEQHTFIAAVGGRLLIGSARLPSDEAAGEADAPPGADDARAIFAAFLEAHAGGGEPAIAAALREPAIAAASLPGLPLIEMVFMPKVLFDAADNVYPGFRNQLATVGIDDIGSVVLRQNFDDGRWRATMAMTLPTPRHGLLEILDQPCDASEVPAFVTREVAEFAQLSLDLGAAYKTVRQLLLAQAEGEQVANMFSVADMQSQAWLGVDVATVLSGLGSRHWFLSFPPQVAEVLAKARAADENGEETTPVVDRLAAVWQVADEGPYEKLIGRLAQLAGGGQLEEEQGFKGVRIPGAAAFYVGRGHVVMAVGDGVLEKTLAAIRTPPQGDMSLRESDVPKRAAELMPARPARGYGVSDATRTGGTLGMLRDLAASMEPDDIEDDSMRGLFVAFKELLPSAREMEGMFGIGATLIRMTDDGLLYETAWEMPAP
jgi:hypothetical protein